MKIALAVTVLALAVVPGAAAKEFHPGDLRVCNAARCVPIMEPQAVGLLGPFYYSGPALQRKLPPARGTAYFELRFKNGYVTGIVATRALDRFLSYGVHLERFGRGVWYRVPPQLSAELKKLTAGMQPLRLTARAVARSR